MDLENVNYFFNLLMPHALMKDLNGTWKCVNAEGQQLGLKFTSEDFYDAFLIEIASKGQYSLREYDGTVDCIELFKDEEHPLSDPVHMHNYLNMLNRLNITKLKYINK